jgi:hypothetical protein
VSIDKTGDSISTWINPDPNSGDSNIYHVQHSYDMLKKLEAMRVNNGIGRNESELRSVDSKDTNKDHDLKILQLRD